VQGKVLTSLVGSGSIMDRRRTRVVVDGELQERDVGVFDVLWDICGRWHIAVRPAAGHACAAGYASGVLEAPLAKLWGRGRGDPSWWSWLFSVSVR